MGMIIANPLKGFSQVKDSPSLLAIIVIPLILIGLTFFQYYMLYMVKMSIPAHFYTDRIGSFLWGWIWYLLMQYIFFMIFGIILASIFFMLGRWAGGYSSLKHSLSVGGYVHVPNILGLLIVMSVILLIPTVKTGIVNYVGYTQTGLPEDNIIVSLGNYTGVDSNLTISVCAYYSIPLNATTNYSNAIMGTTKIIYGEIKATYTEATSDGIKSFVGVPILLNDTSFGYNVPVEKKNVFNSSGYCKNCTNFIVDISIFLNNTYVLPVWDNMSVPYVITLKIFDSDGEPREYEISSSFFTKIIQSPDPRPLFTLLDDLVNPVMRVLSIIISIWQFILLTIASKVIHEFKLSKSIVLTTIYAVAKYFLVGFII
jgi:hypothetical protein